MVAFASTPDLEAPSGPPSSSPFGTGAAVALMEEAETVAVGLLSASRACSTKQGGATFTGYITDNETSLSYARARMYSPTLGRFIGRDPWEMWFGARIGKNRYPRGLPSLPAYPVTLNMHRDGLSLYQAAFHANMVDPTGCFGEGDHHTIIDVGIGNDPTLSDLLEHIKKGSDLTDTEEGAQDLDNAYKHGMRHPDEDPDKAKQRTQDYIDSNMDTAADLYCKGDKKGAGEALGHAMHAGMDTYSRYHRDPRTDTPRPWRGMLNPASWPHLPELGPYRGKQDDMKYAGVGVGEYGRQFKEAVCKKCPEKAPPGWCDPCPPKGDSP